MNPRARQPWRRPGWRLGLTAVAVVVAGSATVATAMASNAPSFGDSSATVPLSQVVPAPASTHTNPGVAFNLTPDDAIYATGGSSDAQAAAGYLAGLLRKPTGYALPVDSITSQAQPKGIALELNSADKGAAGSYQLNVTRRSVTIRAGQREGLFEGIETLRQLLPVKVESPQAVNGPWLVQGGQISDQPRYDYRGAMLDVARNFLPVSDVERYISEIARYKINYLHLHLTDDQGWRIAINNWPNLTKVGGSSGVGGVSSGFYTQAQYKDIVQYAWARGITVIPEIEGPEHMNAALSSYAQLNCNGVAPPLYTGFTESPTGLLCISSATTYKFMDQVIGQIAALTPGPYISIGGDETQDVSPADLATYDKKIAAIVESHGKKIYGWQDAVGGFDASKTPAMTEYWQSGVNDPAVIAAAKAGTKVIMAPSTKAYLDMKYTADEPEYPVGNSWAGYTTASDAYNWNPNTMVSGLPASSVGGVEAPLWTETIFGMDQAEQLAFPRLLEIADIGWAPASAHDWNSFKSRLAAQGPRLREARVNYYLAPGVPWPMGS